MASCELLKNIRESAEKMNLPLKSIERFEATNCTGCNGTVCLEQYSSDEIENILPEPDRNEFNGFVSREQLKREQKQLEVENQGFLQVDKFLRKQKRRDEILFGAKLAG